MNERVHSPLPGVPMLLALLVLSLANFAAFPTLDGMDVPGGLIALNGLGTLVIVLLWCGFFMVQPNNGVVLQLFGRYVGTARDSGLKWANPFYSKKPVSLRVRNFESSKLKVNDLEGSPIEIAAVVVWQVHDTAEAVFQVDDYENFVHVQSEAALRQMATSYPYDGHDGSGANTQIALRSHATEINQHLKEEIQERLGAAGVTVLEARISHLAYAPEIAQAMLQRQQAAAIIAARSRIVEGAVGMVHMALEQLDHAGKIQLDEERKAAMVSNLLVVLCSERGTQPVVNTGTLHH
ncbi:SPFH domain-containing protein [Silanimonas sp.]|jgi:regulator of protease activity HflC (stomatin/prohibitin superfamily)|uniref:SPFH domain-containing protein n=1 Tax=Silanimonas sp. TaxID=1929290 RepID=UPI0037C8519A